MHPLLHTPPQCTPCPALPHPLPCQVLEGEGKEGWLLLRPSLHDPGERACWVLAGLHMSGQPVPAAKCHQAG